MRNHKDLFHTDSITRKHILTPQGLMLRNSVHNIFTSNDGSSWTNNSFGNSHLYGLIYGD